MNDEDDVKQDVVLLQGGPCDALYISKSRK